MRALQIDRRIERSHKYVPLFHCQPWSYQPATPDGISGMFRTQKVERYCVTKETCARMYFARHERKVPQFSMESIPAMRIGVRIPSNPRLCLEHGRSPAEGNTLDFSVPDMDRATRSRCAIRDFSNAPARLVLRDAELHIRSISSASRLRMPWPKPDVREWPAPVETPDMTAQPLAGVCLH